MKNIVLISLYCLSFFTLHGQDELNREVIDVVKDFRPKVMLANKINAQPLFIDTSKVSINLKYQVRFEEFRVYQNIDSLKAKEIDRLLLRSLYTKQLSLGLGNLLNPQLSLSISEGRNTTSMYHAFLKYNGAYSNSIPNDDQYSHLLMGALMKKIFNPFILNTRFSIKDISRFDLSKNDYKNSVFSFNTNINFNDSSKFYLPKSIFISSDFFFRDLRFSERNFVLNINHQGPHEQIKSWIFSNAFEFQRTNSKDYFHWTSDFKIEKDTDLTHFIFGLNIDLLVDQILIFPELRITRQLIENGLFSYLEMGGRRNLYSLQDIYLSNPYIQNSFSPSFLEDNLFSNTQYFARIGLNGNLFYGVSYQVSATATNDDNYIHFTSLENPQDIFKNIPSFTSVNMAIFHADIEAELHEKLLSLLKVDIRTFDESLSYVPEIEIGLYTDYYYNEQWSLSTSFRFLSVRTLLKNRSLEINSFEQYNLPAILDVNLSLDYAHTSMLGFYIKAKNLLNQDYVYWQEWPVLGRQFNFGAKYLF